MIAHGKDIKVFTGNSNPQLAKDICKELGIPLGIHATGRVDPELFEKAVEGMAEEALRDRCTPTNPIQPTKEDLIRLYRESY